MGVVTTKTYVCDGCGAMSSDMRFLKNREGGHGYLSIRGHSMGVNWDGSGAGNDYSKEWFLCRECADKVIEFVESLNNKNHYSYSKTIFHTESGHLYSGRVF